MQLVEVKEPSHIFWVSTETDGFPPVIAQEIYDGSHAKEYVAPAGGATECAPSGARRCVAADVESGWRVLIIANWLSIGKVEQMVSAHVSNWTPLTHGLRDLSAYCNMVYNL